MLIKNQPTTLTDCIHHSKFYVILTSDIYNLYLILFCIILYYHTTEILSKNRMNFNRVE